MKDEGSSENSEVWEIFCVEIKRIKPIIISRLLWYELYSSSYIRGGRGKQNQTQIQNVLKTDYWIYIFVAHEEREGQPNYISYVKKFR